MTPSSRRFCVTRGRLYGTKYLRAFQAEPLSKKLTHFAGKSFQTVRLEPWQKSTMTCSYCGTRNGDGEHRCTRCGRKPEDTLIGGFAMPAVNGALATQLQPAPRMRLVEREQPEQARDAPNFSQAVQASLFHSNVIAMPARETKPRVRTEPGRPATPRTAAKRARPVPEGQGTLDFLPPAPAKPRQLGTSVEAVIYCEAPVATTLHRAVASALDWS